MPKRPDDPLTRPVLEGRRYRLAPFTPAYHQSAYALSIAEPTAFRWRFNGIMPSYDTFERSLHAGVLVQFAVTPRERPEQMIGLVVAYNANPQDGYAYLAAISDPAAGAGSLEGLVLLVNYLLVTWPFRKLYIEVPEFNVGRFQSAIARGLLREEGRLVGHRYMDDRYWDQILYAIYRGEAQRYGADHAHLFA